MKAGSLRWLLETHRGRDFSRGNSSVLLNWALLLNDGDNRIETHHKLSLSFEFSSEFMMFQQLYLLHLTRHPAINIFTIRSMKKVHNINLT